MNPQIVKSLFPEAYQNILNGRCALCGKEIKGLGDFKDELSIREYNISKMCQACQDGIFEEPEEVEE